MSSKALSKHSWRENRCIRLTTTTLTTTCNNNNNHYQKLALLANSICILPHVTSKQFELGDLKWLCFIKSFHWLAFILLATINFYYLQVLKTIKSCATGTFYFNSFRSFVHNLNYLNSSQFI